MNQDAEAPLTVGVFGGSFNPIHLGHTLLAITVQQTKAVDRVVLVPVYKHAVKTDLLPFEDRVNMCRQAIAAFGDGVTVSTIEQQVGESNGAMLRAMRQEYPENTKFLWICGDDFFRWMHRPKGLETLAEVSGMIVQRRLHRRDDGNFYKEPIDETKVRTIAAEMNLSVDYIYGELPHFSSTLVRRAPGHWRSFLTQKVTNYLDERPQLLQQLIANLEKDDNESSERQVEPKPTSEDADPAPTHVVLGGLEVVHALQIERGVTGLRLSTGDAEHIELLKQQQANTDSLLNGILDKDQKLVDYDEVQSLATELERIPVWLEWDRKVLEKNADNVSKRTGSDGWMARLDLVEKFSPRIDVLIGATVRALSEILARKKSVDRNVSKLLLKWCEGKEALGRLRAFVCAGGPDVPVLVRSSLNLREKLCQTIDTKDRRIARVLALQAASRLSAPDALHRMLEQVTALEYKILGCFASSTPLSLVHKLLLEETSDDNKFDVEQFFEASTAALDFLLSFAKALTASACAAT